MIARAGYGDAEDVKWTSFTEHIVSESPPNGQIQSVGANTSANGGLSK